MLHVMPKKKQKSPRSRFLHFPAVRGKVVSGVEIEPDAAAIIILFEDSTAAVF
jgi:hypothetical protein